MPRLYQSPITNHQSPITMDAQYFRHLARADRLDVRRIQNWIKTNPDLNHTQQKDIIITLRERARKNIALAKRIESGEVEVVITGLKF